MSEPTKRTPAQIRDDGVEAARELRLISSAIASDLEARHGAPIAFDGVGAVSDAEERMERLVRRISHAAACAALDRHIARRDS